MFGFTEMPSFGRFHFGQTIVQL